MSPASLSSPEVTSTLPSASVVPVAYQRRKFIGASSPHVSSCQSKAVMLLTPRPPSVAVPPITITRPSASTRLPGAEEVGFGVGDLRDQAGLRIEDVLLAAGREVPLPEEDLAAGEQGRVDRDGGQRDQRAPLADLRGTAAVADGDRDRRRGRRVAGAVAGPRRKRVLPVRRRWSSSRTVRRARRCLRRRAGCRRAGTGRPRSRSRRSPSRPVWPSRRRSPLRPARSSRRSAAWCRRRAGSSPSPGWTLPRRCPPRRTPSPCRCRWSTAATVVSAKRGSGDFADLDAVAEHAIAGDALVVGARRPGERDFARRHRAGGEPGRGGWAAGCR